MADNYAKYAISKTTLDSIAAQAMTLSGTDAAMTTDQIRQAVVDANVEVAAQAQKIAAISDVLTEKGSESSEVGDNATTPIKQNTNDLDVLLAKAQALPDKVVLQEKTVTPSTSVQNVFPDNGYDAMSKVTVKAMPTATQATPSITVSSSGLITASATQSAGYVSKGTKSATSQLTVQAGKTVTPTKSEQTVVEAGRYTTGAVKVAKIPDSYIETNDATAQDVDIVMDKIAYVGGKKVTGTNPYEKAATDSHIANALAEIANKGITVPSGAGVDDLADLIKTIPGEHVYTEIVLFTTDTLDQYEINHNLGVIPTYAMIVQLVSSQVALGSLGCKLEYVHQGILVQARVIQGDTGAIFGKREADTLLTYDDGSARSVPKFINATETKLTLALTGLKLSVGTGTTAGEYHIIVGYSEKSKA